MKRLGLLTGGGDAPGLNAVIRAAVKTAHLQYGCETLGLEEGFDALLPEGKTWPLTLENVRGLLIRGGTVLGTANRGNAFARKVIRDGQEVIEDISHLMYEGYQRLGLDGIIAIGGDGTLRIAYDLQEKYGLKVIGVPKTIDNDLSGTDMTFGFDTAVVTATEAMDKLHTTAESHDRVMVLELMGRDAGFITLYAGLASGVDVILIPEIPFDLNVVAAKIKDRDAHGHNFSIVAVAEGAKPLGGEQVFSRPGDAIYVPRLGGVSYKIGEMLEQLTGKETRVMVLGHLQRGGTPSPYDRWLSTRFGAAAVHAAANGQWGHMVGLQGAAVVTTPLAQVIATLKRVDPNSEIVRSARSIGIVFG